MFGGPQLNGLEKASAKYLELNWLERRQMVSILKLSTIYGVQQLMVLKEGKC